MHRLTARQRLASTLATVLGTVLLACAAASEEPSLPSAPAFELPIIANGTGTYQLESTLRRVTYLDFWASWCGPCRISLPALNEVYKELQDRGVDVIAVSVDVVEEDALDFLQRYRVTYPVLIDTQGDVAKAYGVDGMPSGYLIDRSGVIRDVHRGFRRGDEAMIRQRILALLETGPAS